jgi:hypothetical protein
MVNKYLPYQRAWRQRNKAKVAEYNRRRREYRRKRRQRIRQQNPGMNSAELKQYFANNPGKRNQYRAAYNARKKNLTVPLTVDEQMRVESFYRIARQLTLSTGIRHHVDHVIPLAKGGLHHPDNMQVLTAHENQTKSAK